MEKVHRELRYKDAIIATFAQDEDTAVNSRDGQYCSLLYLRFNAVAKRSAKFNAAMVRSGQSVHYFIRRNH